MRRKKRATSKVTVTFTRVKKPTSHGNGAKSYITQTFQEGERSLISLWMEICPEGVSPIEWYRRWNDGYPSEEDVEIYNALNPDNPFDLEEEI